MGALTGVLYALLGLFLGGWYLGYWSGNFALLLFVLSVVSFCYWLAERFVFLPRRKAAAAALEAQDHERRAKLGQLGIDKIDGDLAAAKRAVLAQPWWLDWTAGLFPVIFAVFLLRSFLFEPFKIPSGSMIPTLMVGDLILVNKYHYGVRLPVINKLVIPNHTPQRGDVMVFRYPRDPSVDYIKRVIGVPGDEISYRSQQLYINGERVPTEPMPEFYDEESMRYVPQFKERLGNADHRILVNPKLQPFYGPPDQRTALVRENCTYDVEGLTCRIPPGHYFMMGDNRDNSQDSRFWGFVPDENIVGKAFFVWMNFSDLSRIGPFH